MTHAHLADDNEALVAYLYEECEADERRRIEHHLAECEHCASEVRELRSVRGALADWTPPAARLGFRIVLDPPKSAWRWAGGSLPASAQVAAAVFLFAAGAAVAQLDVRSGGDGWIIRTKWTRPASTSAPADRTDPVAVRAGEPYGTDPSGHGQVPASDTTRPSDLAAMEQMLRRDLAAAPENDALLRRVQAMIEQSERKQQRELALRLAQVVRDLDAQRRVDLLRVEQNFGQLEGQTGAAVAQQRELLNYLVRVSQQQ